MGVPSSFVTTAADVVIRLGWLYDNTDMGDLA